VDFLDEFYARGQLDGERGLGNRTGEIWKGFLGVYRDALL